MFLLLFLYRKKKLYDIKSFIKYLVNFYFVLILVGRFNIVKDVYEYFLFIKCVRVCVFFRKFVILLGFDFFYFYFVGVFLLFLTGYIRLGE